MKQWLLASCLLAAQAWACDSPDQLEQVGEAQLRHWGFKVYTARTFSCKAAPLSADGLVSGPFALSLTYEREITAEALVQATRAQWQALGLLTDRTDHWLEQLRSIWPDVRKGDQLTLFIDAQGQSRFYFGNQPLGQLKEAAFGPLFAAIWLHPESRYPDVRSALMGAS